MPATCKKNLFVAALVALLVAFAAVASTATPASAHSKTDSSNIQCFIVNPSNPYDYTPCVKTPADNNDENDADDNDNECHHNSTRTYVADNDNQVDNDAVDNNPDNNDDDANEHLCPAPAATTPVTPAATPQSQQTPAPTGASSTTPAISARTMKVYCITGITVYLGSQDMKVFGRQTFRINGSLVASKYVAHARSGYSVHLPLPASARRNLGKFILSSSLTYNKHGHIVKAPHAFPVIHCAKNRAPRTQVYMTDAPRRGSVAPQVLTVPFGTSL